MWIRKGYRTIPLAALVAVSLGTMLGCSEPLSTREKGTLTGAALGAGTGAIFGGGKGAAIGGAAGAVGGAIVGDQMQRREYDQYEQQRAYESQRRDAERRQRDADDY